MAITVTVNKPGPKVTISGTGRVVTPAVPTKVVNVNSTAIPTQNASNLALSPSGSLEADTVQGAIDELAGNDFRSNNTPTGSQVSEGDTWYDTDDNQYKIYRETNAGVFQWVPIMVGAADGDSDTLDAGAF